MCLNSDIGTPIEAAIDWRALDKESEEFRAYYLQRQREGFYQSMGVALEGLSDDQSIRYWSSLDKDRQEALVNEALAIENQYMNASADLDDIEKVGSQVFKLVYMTLMTILTRKHRSSQILQKTAGSKYHKARTDNLLRKAIHNYQTK